MLYYIILYHIILMSKNAHLRHCPIKLPLYAILEESKLKRCEAISFFRLHQIVSDTHAAILGTPLNPMAREESYL